jgi:hypothetical protein
VEWLAKVAKDVLSGPTVRVWWYYRAGDIAMNDGEGEIFLSDHHEEVELETVSSFIHIDETPLEKHERRRGLFWRRLFFAATKGTRRSTQTS